MLHQKECGYKVEELDFFLYVQHSVCYLRQWNNQFVWGAVCVGTYTCINHRKKCRNRSWDVNLTVFRLGFF